MNPTITYENSLYIEKMLTDMNIMCILHESYHSGTINTRLKEYHTFFQAAAKMEIPVFLAGATKGVAYESTNVYDKLHIIPVYNISPAALYVKLWMLLSHSMMTSGQAETAIDRDIPVFRGDCLHATEEMLNTSIGGDIFYM